MNTPSNIKCSCWTVGSSNITLCSSWSTTQAGYDITGCFQFLFLKLLIAVVHSNRFGKFEMGTFLSSDDVMKECAKMVGCGIVCNVKGN